MAMTTEGVRPGEGGGNVTAPRVSRDVSADASTLGDRTGDLPVVARLVVEIRSDGSTTIARAGLADELHAHRTVFEARGSTPLALALNLARHIVQLSLRGPRTARALLTPQRRPPRE